MVKIRGGKHHLTGFCLPFVYTVMRTTSWPFRCLRMKKTALSPLFRNILQP